MKKAFFSVLLSNPIRNTIFCKSSRSALWFTMHHSSSQLGLKWAPNEENSGNSGLSSPVLPGRNGLLFADYRATLHDCKSATVWFGTGN
ncbi:hypothetical protein HDF08_003975 [Edaphobacter lichenicola]|uniref:Uncharacterized protein n=1 Tax=Tunturiibacter lichenicola TaxID=2051959 RepID=A0A852VQL4_9BACT|nr:hypothetical protein [Edaphobacter lichenicola]